MASVSPFLIGFPVLLMLASIGLQFGGFTGGPGSATGSTTITCAVSINGTPCQILAYCPSPPIAAPAFCFGGITVIPSGSFITLPNSVLSSGSSSSTFFYSFGAIGPDGFIVIIGVIVTFVALLGFSALSVGLNQESLHIVFMGAMMLGTWGFLSALDGFLAGNPDSLFTLLNSPIISFAGLAMGTSLYILSTFGFLIGFVALVKRGG